MQTAIDRVIRSFTFFGASPMREKEHDEPMADAAADQAVDLAEHLFGHYRDTLARRVVKAG